MRSGRLGLASPQSLKAARVAENGVKIVRLLIGTTHDPTPRRGARGAPHAVHFTLRFSAEVFPLFATSSYWTCWPSLRVDRPALSTAEIWTKTSLPPPWG